MKKIFISYTWENEEHKEWVKKLAMLLEKDSIGVPPTFRKFCTLSYIFI